MTTSRENESQLYEGVFRHPTSLTSSTSDLSPSSVSSLGCDVSLTAIHSVASSTKAIPFSLQKRILKTKICIHNLCGRCSRGALCSFAHSSLELKERPDLYKTRLCERFAVHENCPKGESCRFAHGDSELRSTVEFFKTSLCPYYQAGLHCSANDRCRWAHGLREIRQRGGGSAVSNRVNPVPSTTGRYTDSLAGRQLLPSPLPSCFRQSPPPLCHLPKVENDLEELQLEKKRLERLIEARKYFDELKREREFGEAMGCPVGRQHQRLRYSMNSGTSSIGSPTDTVGSAGFLPHLPHQADDVPPSPSQPLSADSTSRCSYPLSAASSSQVPDQEWRSYISTLARQSITDPPVQDITQLLGGMLRKAQRRSVAYPVFPQSDFRRPGPHELHLMEPEMMLEERVKHLEFADHNSSTLSGFTGGSLFFPTGACTRDDVLHSIETRRGTERRPFNPFLN